MSRHPLTDDVELLNGLLEVGASLAEPDRARLLNTCLRRARTLTGAEGGTLYVLEDGRLRFAATQNDRLDVSSVAEGLLGRELDVSTDCLAGFVASTGEPLRVDDAYHPAPGAPFRMDRAFDAALDYRTRSVVAVPLTCPDGTCVGVLELINHVGPGGRVGPFPDVEHDGLRALSAMAAVSIHNHMLQEQLKAAHLETIFRLAVAAEFRDDDTGRHVRRMSRTSALLGRRLGLNDERVELLEYAAAMHDIGKIGIPDAILQKSGPLTAAERRIVQTHPQIGADILGEPSNELIAMAREIALTHHERWDGGGYPAGLAGDRIPLVGRIVGIADVLDALISKRCYKQPCAPDVALEILAGQRGRHFDPAVLDVLLNCADAVLDNYDAGQ